MKKLFLTLLACLIIPCSLVYAEEQKDLRNKVIMFIDPTQLSTGAVFEVMQYLFWHPDIDASVVMKDITESDLEDYKKFIMSPESEDNPLEDARLERWFVQEDKLEKAGYIEKIRKFLQEYAEMELANLTKVEQVETRWEPVVDQGNRFSEKFRISQYPVMVVVDVKTKRVTKYPLPSKFFDAIKDLDYLLNTTAEDVFSQVAE